MDANMAALAPDELMKTWTAMGVQATDQFRQLMTAAATASSGAKK